MTSFALGEIHVEVRDTAARFAKQTLAPVAEAIDGGEGIPAAVSAQLAELGFWGIATPEERGGVGLDALAYALVVEALATGSPSVARRVAAHAGPALAGLVATDRALEALCSGEAFASYVPAPGALAPAPADLYVGPTAWADSAAVTPVDTTGHRGAGLARVTLQAPQALTGSLSLDAWNDVGLAAIALGSGRAALAAALAYAQERKQFGKALASFQAIQWKIADSVMALDAAELAVHRAALTLDPADAATARVLAGRGGLVATDHALQIHGGYGYTREYPVERHLRSARMIGGEDAARRSVAARLLG